MIRINKYKEPSLTAKLWRLMYGPAQIADGVVSTVTLGYVVTGLALATARRTSLARMRSETK